MAALIGALRVSLSADTAQFDAGMRRAQSTASSAATGIQKSLSGLKAGIAGFVGALSVGMFVNAVRGALEYAGSLAEVAQQLGVTARDLQTFRFAAGQVGVSQEQLETGLSKLTITLGKVAAGAKEPAKAFGAIGISVDQLKGKDTGEAFRMIADGLQKVTDRSQRAALEVAYFGKTGSKLDNLLSGGSAALNQLTEAAEKLGIVLSDEQIQKADETADKMAALKTVLSAQIAGTVADNADAILGLANALSTLVGWIGQSLTGWRILIAEFKAAGGALANLQNPFTAADAAGDAIRQGGLAYGVGSVTTKLPMAKPIKTAAGADIGKFLAPSGGKPKKAREDHSAEKALRESFQFDQDLRRSQMDVLHAQEDLAKDYIERTTIGIQILNAEKEAYAAELQYQTSLHKLSKGKEGLSEAQAAQLQAQYDIKDSLEREKVLQEEREQRQRDIQDLTQHDFDRRRDVLESQDQLATTAAERRKIELQLLELAYEQKRQALQAIIDTDKDGKAREDARRDLVNLNQTHANDRQGVLNSTRGPLEEWAASIPQTAAQINEAFQSIEAEGLDSLSDAIGDVISGTRSLKDAFGDLAKSIIQDLIKMTVRMLIFRALSGVFGGSVGGGGGFSTGSLSFGSEWSGSLPKFATGGSFTVGGNKGIDKNLLSMNGLPIARVSHGETINVGSAGMGGGQQRIVVELRNEMLDAKIASGADVQIVRRYPAMKADTLNAVRDGNRRAA